MKILCVSLSLFQSKILCSKREKESWKGFLIAKTESFGIVISTKPKMMLLLCGRGTIFILWISLFEDDEEKQWNPLECGSTLQFVPAPGAHDPALVADTKLFQPLFIMPELYGGKLFIVRFSACFVKERPRMIIFVLVGSRDIKGRNTEERTFRRFGCNFALGQMTSDYNFARQYLHKSPKQKKSRRSNQVFVFSEKKLRNCS